MSARASRRLVAAGALAAGLLAAERDADAVTRIEQVVSPGGIEAYLVNEPSIPLIAVSIRFEGGAALDPPDRSGLANMISGLLDEGAGDYDSQTFRAALEDNAIRLSFEAGRDALTGELSTLTKNRDLAFDLLRLALTEPRFDPEPIERIRSQIVVGLKREMQDPDRVAANTWFRAAYPGHPYERPVRGTLESVAAITADDLKDFAATRLARDNLWIGVAGDITAEELAPLLDEVFGALPESAGSEPVAEATPAGGETLIVERGVPQSVVTFGAAGVARDDPDYYAAYVANHILGGGGFTSRLMEEVREKRGLAYSVYSYLYPAEHSPLWMGGVATSNAQVAESIAVIRGEIARMAAGEITEQDLDDTKTYITGSFPLRLTSNAAIAGLLVGVQRHHLGLDYMETRNAHIEAVTLDDVRRVARRLFDAERMLVVVVGEPEGLEGQPTDVPQG